MSLTIGSLFSGVGGFELGLERAGLGPVLWQVEANEFRRRVLAKHWPRVRRYDDVRTATDLPRVDLTCGGFPCQDLSSANPTATGMAGARSGLWSEYARIVGEIRPRCVLVENVHGAWRRWLPFVRRDLHGLGYASVPFRVRASEVGALHIRARVFVVAYAAGECHHLRQRSGWQDLLAASCAHVGATDVLCERPQMGAGAEGHGEDRQEPEQRHAADSRRLKGSIQPEARGPEGSGFEFGSFGDEEERAIEPTLVRGVHGVSHRVDRVAALGDAIYPACAEAIGRLVLEVLS